MLYVIPIMATSLQALHLPGSQGFSNQIPMDAKGRLADIIMIARFW
jgi:hypothetical protein